MRVISNFVLVYCLSFTSFDVFAQTSNPNYDPKLAAKLGADDYGMKSFIFVLLKTGTNSDDDQEMKNKAFAGHFKNINRLVEEKKLIVARAIQSTWSRFVEKQSGFLPKKLFFYIFQWIVKDKTALGKFKSVRLALFFNQLTIF